MLSGRNPQAECGPSSVGLKATNTVAKELQIGPRSYLPQRVFAPFVCLPGGKVASHREHRCIGAPTASAALALVLQETRGSPRHGLGLKDPKS